MNDAMMIAFSLSNKTPHLNNTIITYSGSNNDENDTDK